MYIINCCWVSITLGRAVSHPAHPVDQPVHIVQVISGCEWGDILVWDEQLIDVQVTGKDRQPCHSAPIIMFLYSEQTAKLTSVGMDGMVKFWNYRTVDLANPPDNDRVLELEPSFTIAIEDSIGTAKILGVCKINGDPNSGEYFIQVPHNGDVAFN